MVARATVATRTTLPLTPSESSTISKNSARGARAIHEPPKDMLNLDLFV